MTRGEQKYTYMGKAICAVEIRFSQANAFGDQFCCECVCVCVQSVFKDFKSFEMCKS